MGTLLDVAAAVVPPIGVGLVFWFAMRAIVRADSSERAAIARMDSAAESAEKRDG